MKATIPGGGAPALNPTDSPRPKGVVPVHRQDLGAFAAPPVGPRRFQAPESAQPWHGVREADVFGPPPPQSRMGLAPNAVPAGPIGAWVAFARDGDPGWPTYDERQRLTRVFDRDPNGGVRAYPEEVSRELSAAYEIEVADLPSTKD